MLVAVHITKRFGDLIALDDVSIDFTPGEIHAVLGENGAGKSTFMNILAGFLTPSSGKVLLDGSEMPFRPRRSRGRGVEMVHQHFKLVPAFTVAENLALARLDRLGKRLNVADASEPALRAARGLGWDLDPKALVRNLSVGAQQRVEILKCLSGDAKVIIFDEPTAVLAPDEVRELFRVLRELTRQEKTVILIAHKLSEVMAVADRVTVLRQGEKVASARISEVNESMLARWMVGDMPALRRPDRFAVKAVALLAKNLKVQGDRDEEIIRGVDLKINEGEILGIGGVDGNGQVELAETLALIRPRKSGTLDWKSKGLESMSISISYIPQDRQVDGLAMSLTVRENLLISGQRRGELRLGAFWRSGVVRDWVRAVVEKFDIRIESPATVVSNLSGGNQQKVVVGRNLDRRPDLLVAVNPTRGLDVKATRFVHDQILKARQEGAAVALFSSDLDELAALSDRRLFLSRGMLVEGGIAELVGGSP